MRFENQICPVCSEKFKENDEIVVCPECGTPHHKECYNSLGECKNKSFHSENFSFTPVEEKSEKLDVLIEDEVKKTEDVINVVNVEFNGEDSKNNEEIKSTIEELFKNINGKSTDQVLINNVPSSFYEVAVGKNQNYYMPRFLIMEGTQKKQFMNIVAFIFPFAWAIYRKMYKIAILIFCLYVAIMSVAVAPVLMDEELMSSAAACAVEDPNFGQKLLLYMAGENVTFTKTQSEFITLSENFKMPAVVFYGTKIASIALKIFMGLCGTKLYKSKLSKDIEKVNNLPLDNVQKKNYLKTKCGVTPMIIAVFAAFIEYSFFGSF